MKEKDNINKIINLINKVDTVSFDVFDTLLFRNVYKPTDIFMILENEFNISGLAKMRIQAEYNSRTIENNNETTLVLIYEELANNLNDKKLAKKK